MRVRARVPEDRPGLPPLLYRHGVGEKETLLFLLEALCYFPNSAFAGNAGTTTFPCSRLEAERVSCSHFHALRGEAA